MSTDRSQSSKPLPRWLARDNPVTLRVILAQATGQRTPPPCSPTVFGLAIVIASKTFRDRLSARALQVISDSLTAGTTDTPTKPDPQAIAASIERIVSVIAASYHWTRESILDLTPRYAVYHCSMIKAARDADTRQQAAMAGAKIKGSPLAEPSLYRLVVTPDIEAQYRKQLISMLKNHV